MNASNLFSYSVLQSNSLVGALEYDFTRIVKVKSNMHVAVDICMSPTLNVAVAVDIYMSPILNVAVDKCMSPTLKCHPVFRHTRP